MNLPKHFDQDMLKIPEGFIGKIVLKVDGGAVVPKLKHRADCQCAECCPRTPGEAAERLYDMALAEWELGSAGDLFPPEVILDVLGLGLGRPTSEQLEAELGRIRETSGRFGQSLKGPGPKVPENFDASVREEL